MSAGWNYAPIGELCDLINGRAFKPSDWVEEGLPIIRIQNLNDEAKPFNRFAGKVSGKHLVENGEILLSWSGTPGTSFGCFRWARGPGVLNQHIFKVLIEDSKIDGDFFINAVNSRLHEMIAQAHGGVGLRHITKGKLEAIRLPVPPLEEQRRIVARIKECMERVEEIERLRSEANEEREALGPALYEAIEKNSEWEERAVGELILNSRNGRSIRQDNENSNGFVLSLRSVHSVSLDVTSKKPINLSHALAQTYAIREGDVFVSRSNTRDLVGLSSVAVHCPERTIFPDLLIHLKVNEKVILPRYLAYSLRTQSARRQIRERAVGTSQSMVKISAQRLKEVKIPVPSIEEQRELISKLDEASENIQLMKLEAEGCSISNLRDAILRRAFAGEL